MNIFILDKDIERNVQYHVDKHVVKMILEYAQLLCTACHVSGDTAPYRATHINHPCNIWVRSSITNWTYLRHLCLALGEEYTHRYGKVHKSIDIVKSLKFPKLSSGPLTDFAQAMPDHCKKSNAVEAYRDYYIKEKSHIAKWSKRSTPYWFKESLCQT